MAKRCFGCMKIKSDAPVCEHCGHDEKRQNYPHQLPVGTVLQGRYYVGKVLGQGGFGITYIGWDAALQAPVAIKEYYPGSFVTRKCSVSRNVVSIGKDDDNFFEKNRDRFLKEAKILASLNGVPGIVDVQSLFSENNTAYIVMEYIQGMNLKQYMKEKGGPISAGELGRFFKPLLYALNKVHREGLVHRDISPDNIMIQTDGNIKLLDFGAARKMENADVYECLPQSTEAILKHGFAPLEQYRRRGSLGPWTDIYGLCATIYFCLTGVVPDSAPERIMGDDNINWRAVPGLSAWQADTLERGMKVLPEERIQSLEELWKGLFDPPPKVEPVQKNKTILPDNPGEAAVRHDPVEKDRGNSRRKYTAGLCVLLVLAAVLAIPMIQKNSRAVPLTEPTGITLQGDPLLQTEGSLAEEPEYTAADAAPDTIVMMEPVAEMEIPWKDNLMMANPNLLLLGVDQSEITEAVFWDTVENAPDFGLDVSENQDNRVLAWVEKSEDGYCLNYAAEGGINAANACKGLFASYSNLKTVEFNGCFHTEEVKNMGSMFSRCVSLQTVDISGFDTSSLIDMRYMFYNCESLATVDFSGFTTENVYTMCEMFARCTSLKTLDLSGFDFSGVDDMSGMFSRCENLSSLNLGEFNISQNTKTTDMYLACYRLPKGDKRYK